MITWLYNAIRAAIFSLIYPATRWHKATNADFKEAREDFYNNTTRNITNIRDQVYGNMNNAYQMDIDAAMITHRDNELYDPSIQYVIHCDGNATCYEALYDELESLINSNTSYLVFNPPGVVLSPGTTRGPEDYATALKCMVEHLHAEGIPYENIVLSGRSLGAGIATMVAADYQRNNIRIKLFNDRSFADLAIASATYVKNRIPTAPLRATLGNMLYFTVKGLINTFNLNINPAKAFTYINEKHPGDAQCVYTSNDLIIPDSCNLCSGLDQHMQNAFTMQFVGASALTPNNDSHNLPLDYLYDEASGLTASIYKKSKLATFWPAANFAKLYENQAKQLMREIEYLLPDVINFTDIRIKNMDVNELLAAKITLRKHHYVIDKLATELITIDITADQMQDSRTKNLVNLGTQILEISNSIDSLIEHKLSLIEAVKPSKIPMILYRNKSRQVAPENIDANLDLKQVIEHLHRISRDFQR